MAMTEARQRANESERIGTLQTAPKTKENQKLELIYVYRVTVCLLSISQGKTQWNLP